MSFFAELKRRNVLRLAAAYVSVSALVAAVRGDTKESECLAKKFLRESDKDLTGRALYSHIACSILGIAGAAEAAVDCIRTGLEEPSHVMPIVDPFLPYYDRIRTDPEFFELLAELGDAAGER